MTTSTESPAAAETVQCAPWCVDGGGHTDVAFGDDQVCFGAERRVELRLHPFIPNEVMGAETGDWRSAPDYVAVYAARRPGQADTVELSHAGGPAMTLTRIEAETLGRCLLALVEAAR